jgi:hypothetical protein
MAAQNTHKRKRTTEKKEEKKEVKKVAKKEEKKQVGEKRETRSKTIISKTRLRSADPTSGVRSVKTNGISKSQVSLKEKGKPAIKTKTKSTTNVVVKTKAKSTPTPARKRRKVEGKSSKDEKPSKVVEKTSKVAAGKDLAQKKNKKNEMEIDNETQQKNTQHNDVVLSKPKLKPKTKPKTKGSESENVTPKTAEQLQREEEERILNKQQQENVSQSVWSSFLLSIKKTQTENDFWKRIFYLGTEIHLYPSLLSRTYDFSHLEKDLTTSFVNENVYLFGCTEGHAFDLHVDLVPVIVVVVSQLPPPEKVALTSLQQVREEIKPFRSWHLSWSPLYPPHTTKHTNPDHTTTHQYALTFLPPRTNTKPSDDIVRGYQFLLPYIRLPRLLDEFEPQTDIEFSMEVNEKVCAMDYNIELDEIQQRALDLCEEHNLPPLYVNVIRERLVEEKKKLKEMNEAQRKALHLEFAKFSKSHLESLKAIRIYKYYPLSLPSHIRSHFVNRSYGQCEAVRPPCAGMCAKCAQQHTETASTPSSELPKESEMWLCVACLTPNAVQEATCVVCTTPRP